MADTLGMKDLNGINIDRVAKGFADEAFVFKQFLTVSPTSNRELRYWRKTAGVIGTTNTTGITKNQSVGAAFGALPPIAEQSMTRVTAFVKHFAIESPWISDADIRDSDPDIWAANVRDLTRSIANQIDFRILDVMSGSTLLSGSALGSGWNDSTNGNPFLDLLSGSMEIRKKGYSIGQTTAWIHPDNFKSLADYLVTQKGSNIPAFSSKAVQDLIITKIANVNIVVSNNCTVGQVLLVTPQRSATWKTFTPLAAIIKTEEQVGKKIRVAEDGEITFTDPNSTFLITGV